MYLIRVDHITYERRGGGTFTLVEAMRELLGVRNAQVLREDGTLAVDRAGSTTQVVHAPTGRIVTRRLTRRAATTLHTHLRRHAA